MEELSVRYPLEIPAAKLARELIDTSVLTPYQAQHLLSNQPGRLVLAQYRILEELGRGGMGQVYKALHVVMGRVVALKIIAAELVSDAHALALFRREIQAVTLLHHPNIVMAYDANECDGVQFLVMEYVDGPNLDAVVKRRGALPVPLACALVTQAAHALQYAHEKGMVHRDIKPANLLLAGWNDGLLGWTRSTVPAALPVVKVLDFGLARLRLSTADTLPVRSVGNVVGTPDYISPEQAHDIHAADIRSDLYSLGCTLYYMLTGRVPFPGESALEKVLHHALETPAPLPELCPDAPARVVAIVERLMAKNPNDRFQMPAELAEALAPFSAGKAAPRERGPLLPSSPATDAPTDSDTELLTADDSADNSGAGEQDTAAAWDDWLAVLESFLRGSGSRGGLGEAWYAAQHAAVVAACRRRADETTGETQRRLRGLLESIRPWLSLEALARTDRSILHDVLDRCRECESLLWGARRRPTTRPWRWLGIAGAIVAGIVLGWQLFAGADGAPTARRGGLARVTLDTATQWASAVAAEVQAHPLLWGGSLSALVVLFAVYLVARLPRM